MIQSSRSIQINGQLMFMRKFGFLLVLVLIVSYGSPAHSCSCVFYPLTLEGISDKASRHEVIFVGTVQGVVDVASSNAGASNQMRIATLVVVEAFKGVEIDKEVLVLTKSSMCDVSFAPDQSYLVFASYRKLGDELNTSTCSTDRLLDVNEDDSQGSAAPLWAQSREMDLLRQLGSAAD